MFPLVSEIFACASFMVAFFIAVRLARRAERERANRPMTPALERELKFEANLAWLTAALAAANSVVHLLRLCEMSGC